MRKYLILGLLAMLATTLSHGQVTTVAHVDVDRYLGLWYEISRIPNRFQDNRTESKSACLDTTAEYSALDSGKISVTNTCTRLVAGKPETEVARAIAFMDDPTTNAKLKVNFTGIALLRWLGIGNGDYWILGLGPSPSQTPYRWALVGSPSRKYGWILSRTKTLPEAEVSKILDLAESNGYARSDFKTPTQ